MNQMDKHLKALLKGLTVGGGGGSMGRGGGGGGGREVTRYCAFTVS